MKFYAFLAMAALAVAGCAEPANNNGEDDTQVNGAPTGAVTNTTAAATTGAAPAGNQVTDAVCVILGIGDSGVSGTVHFHQDGDQVQVTGEVMGLEPGQHGFHVHELGDLTNMEDGTSTGGHYNPTDEKHGRPEDEERHVGDLGNIEAGEDGKATIDMTDSVISLNGPHSILGRGIVIHAGEDKFTQPTGDAGARVGVGVIGIAKPAE